MLIDKIEESLNKFVEDILKCKTKDQITNKCEELSNLFVNISIELHGSSDKDLCERMKGWFTNKLNVPNEFLSFNEEYKLKYLYALLDVVDVIFSSDFSELFCKESCREILNKYMYVNNRKLIYQTSKYIGKIVSFNLRDFIDEEWEMISVVKSRKIEGFGMDPTMNDNYYQNNIVNLYNLSLQTTQQQGSTSNNSSINLNSSAEQLNESTQLSDFSKILILSQLVINSSSMCYAYKKEIMNMLKVFMFDEDIEIRQQSYIAMEQFLKTMNDKVVFVFSMTLVKSNLSDTKIQENDENHLHGAILILFAFINTYLDMESGQYYEILNIALNVIRKTKSSLVRQQALLFLSRMCELYTDWFCPIEAPTLFTKEGILDTPAKAQLKSAKRNSGLNLKDLKDLNDMLGNDWLEKYVEQEIPPFYNIMYLLIDFLQKNIERSTIFRVLGDFCEYIPSKMLKYFKVKELNLLNKNEFDLIRKMKSEKDRKDHIFSLLYCLTKVIKYLKEEEQSTINQTEENRIEHKVNEIVKILHGLIPNIVEMGLNRYVVELFNVAFNTFSEVKRQYQDMLFKLINPVLFDEEQSINKSQPLFNIDKKELILLALQTLSSYNYTEDLHKKFSILIKNSFNKYIDDEDTQIKIEAAKLTKVLLPNEFKEENVLIYDIDDILNNLLNHALSETDSDIRKTILLYLDGRFDYYLSQKENIQKIFIAMNDENFQVRKQAVCIICRLTSYNFTYIIPTFRKFVIELVSQLKYGIELISIEESIILMGNVIQTSGSLILPYIDSIVEVIMPKLTDNFKANSTSLKGNLLFCITELICLGNIEEKYIHTTLDVIISVLQEKGTSKQKTTLRSIGLRSIIKIMRNASCAIGLYQQYPKLLDLLLEMIRAEKYSEIKTEIISVLGTLGALDPLKYKNKQTNITIEDVDETSELQSLSIKSQTTEYYIWSILATLVRVLKDNTQGSMHTLCIRSISDVVTTMNNIQKHSESSKSSQSRIANQKSIYSFVFTTLMNIYAKSDNSMRNEIFMAFEKLLTSANRLVRDNYLPKIFKLIEEHWDDKLLTSICNLYVKITTTIGDEMQKYLPMILQKLLAELNQLKYNKDITRNKVVSPDLFKCFITFAENLNIDEHLYNIIPIMLDLFSDQLSIDFKLTVLPLLLKFLASINITEYANRIIFTVAKLLLIESLSSNVLILLQIIANKLGRDYLIYHSTLMSFIKEHPNQTTPMIEMELNKLKENISLDQNAIKTTKTKKIILDEPFVCHSPKLLSSSLYPQDDDPTKIESRISTVETLFNNYRRQTKPEEWSDWIEKLFICILENSPSEYLKKCANIAKQFSNLTFVKDLFNCSFYSIYITLDNQRRDTWIKRMEDIINYPSVTHEVISLMLNIIDFLDHNDFVKPSKILCDPSKKIGAYAKAIHYNEIKLQEFKIIHKNERRYSIGEEETTEQQKIYENLIGLNNQLQRQEAASGLIQMSEKENQMKLNSSWFAKLGMWHKALSKLEEEKNNDDNVKMICLYEMGDWDSLHEITKTLWNPKENTSKIASNHLKEYVPMIATAAFHLDEWNELNNLINSQLFKELNEFDQSYYKIINFLHNGTTEDLLNAQEQIDITKKQLADNLTLVIDEGYDRCYRIINQAEMVTELEEILTIKKGEQHILDQNVLIKNWDERLSNSNKDIKSWKRLLKLRELIISKQDNIKSWIQYIELCQKLGENQLAIKALNMLSENTLEPTLEKLPRKYPEIGVSYIQYLWQSSKKIQEKQQCYSLLQEYQTVINQLTTDNQLKAKVSEQLSEWELFICQQTNTLSKENISVILNHYRQTITLTKDNYNYWHRWATINFEVVNFFENTKSQQKEQIKNLRNQIQQSMKINESTEQLEETEETKILKENERKEKELQIDMILKEMKLNDKEMINYIVESINAFVQSILLCENNQVIQDSLRLLTILFKYGQYEEVENALSSGVNDLPIDIWVHVIPQIIARIQSEIPAVRRITKDLLTLIGKTHPQSIVFALNVASKSPNIYKKNIALNIIEKIKKESGHLVQQAMLVSEELIGAAIIPHEMWKEAIGDASGEFYINKDFPGMMKVIRPMMEKLENPKTPRDESFALMYGNNLREAYKYCLRYEKIWKPEDELEYIDECVIAWEIYGRLHMKLTQEITKITSLDLSLISPRLMDANDLDIAVPGTYRANNEIIRIKGFNPNLGIIPSKQRPRKLTIYGTNGKEYKYVLKGHEDLRQDERVMQLFGLVNDLLSSDSETSKDHLFIHCYDVVPLSAMSGLIGWVPHSDTFHQVVKEYRELNGIDVDYEIKLSNKLSRRYDHLTSLQKLEIFEKVLQETEKYSHDLSKALWLKSSSTEVWLERRTNFTKSAALMSMVGYILGLGDRHPQNLMLQKYTGNVVHIDFGDCFEVAMNREFFPERIPFRLTRMIVNAMEVSGIEGTFRITCEKVMKVLRENKDSLMAVLEAFVYDPLIVTILEGNHRTENANVMDDKKQTITNVNKTTNEEDLMLTYNGSIEINDKAGNVTKRVLDKLTGKDFGSEELNVENQVDKLIQQAISHENLMHCYQGWFPYW